MTFVFEKEMKLATLKVEYVVSSVTNEIKIVEMYYGGQPSKPSYMSDESRLELMDELERHYLDNHFDSDTVSDYMLYGGA